jgi:PIN domain nuclease of toxin-antitoxin system
VRLLLDTHTLFWAIIDDALLSSNAKSALRSLQNESFVSIASVWEMAIKVGLGKWPEAAALVDNFEKEIIATGFRLLPISAQHARAAGLMQAAHRDPFDRLLAAQAQIEGLTVVTADARVQGLGAAWLW